jgi:hypothetical protein
MILTHDKLYTYDTSRECIPQNYRKNLLENSSKTKDFTHKNEISGLKFQKNFCENRDRHSHRVSGVYRVYRRFWKWHYYRNNNRKS